MPFHRTGRMVGFHIEAVDGRIGHVDDFLLDEQGWVVRYFMVDTSNWIGGQSVLISSAVVDEIDSVNKRIRIRLTRAAVEASPRLESVDVVAAENLPSIVLL